MTDIVIEKKYVQTEHGKIFYFFYSDHTVHANVGRPTVLLLHGLSSSHLTWEGLAHKLVGQGYAVIAPDLRGHGFSEKTRRRKLYRLERQSYDMKALLDAEGVDRAHVVGYSWGGQIGLDFAIRYRERVQTVTVISASHVPLFSHHQFSFLIRPFIRLGRMALIGLGYLFLWHRRNEYDYFVPGQSTGYWSSTFNGLATMPMSINLWMLAEVVGVDFRDKLTLDFPTLIIYGERDIFITEKEIALMVRGLPQARVVRMDNSSHYLASHYEEEIATHIIPFLKHFS